MNYHLNVHHSNYIRYLGSRRQITRRIRKYIFRYVKILVVIRGRGQKYFVVIDGREARMTSWVGPRAHSASLRRLRPWSGRFTPVGRERARVRWILLHLDVGRADQLFYFVLGNEACDFDSIASALALAYHMSFVQPSENLIKF